MDFMADEEFDGYLVFILLMLKRQKSLPSKKTRRFRVREKFKKRSARTLQQFSTWTVNRIQRQRKLLTLSARSSSAPKLRKFLFSLNYLERLFFNISFAKSEPHFYLRIYFEDFIKNTIYLTHHLNSFVGFLWSYRIWACLREIKMKKFW